MSPEMLALQLGATHARTIDALAELVEIAAMSETAGDAAGDFAVLADQLRGTSDTNLAQLLAVALQHLVAARRYREAADAEIRRLRDRTGAR